MFTRSRLIRAVGLLAAVSLIAAGCGGNSGSGGSGAGSSDDTTGIVNGTLPSDGPPEDGGTLTVNDASDAPTLDGMKSATAYTHSAISGIVYSKLLEFKVGRDIPFGSMGVQGDLAEKWGRSDDGLTWTFNLHKGVKWQNVAPVNGREFTSADVVCTVDRINKLPGVQKNLMDIVSKVETPDPYTVVFDLKSPYAAFDETMASFYMEIYPCEGTRGDYDLASTAIGTGPFILQKWDRKVQRTYVKNTAYFVPGKPHLDQVNVLVMSDPNAAMAAMRTGSLDVTGSINDQLLPALTSSNADIVVRSQMGLTIDQIMFNQTKKPFDDVRVRTAIAMAWDREGMGKTYYGANGYALSGPFPPSLFGGMPSDDVLKAIPYDPAGAKKLLADAGYPNGFSVEMLTTDGYGPQFVNQAQWVQEDLKKIGITISLRILDYATYFSEFQSMSYSIGWGLGTGFLTTDEWLQSLYKTGGPRNWFGISDPTLDQMINEQQAEIDKDKREAKLHDINDYIMKKVVNPFIGMTYSGLLTQQTWVHNLYTHPQYARPYMADVWLSSDAPGRK